MQNWRGWRFCASSTDGGVSSGSWLTAGGDSSGFCEARHLILLLAPSFVLAAVFSQCPCDKQRHSSGGRLVDLQQQLCVGYGVIAVHVIGESDDGGGWLNECSPLQLVPTS
jgi:hypothetical protein